MKVAEAAEKFLAQQRIVVTGVSRSADQHGANVVYKRLKDCGYTVFAVNPNTDEVEGDPAYPDLASVPGPVDAVVIGTSAAHAADTMQQAIDLGVRFVWMHRSFGAGSVSPEATRLGREAGVLVIDGGCPLMFGKTSDGGHRFMCRMLKATGKVPRTV